MDMENERYLHHYFLILHAILEDEAGINMDLLQFLQMSLGDREERLGTCPGAVAS